MHLAITTPFLEAKGGVERVVLKIAEHFDASIHVVRYDANSTFPEFKNLDVHVHHNAFGKLPLGNRIGNAIEAGSIFYNLKLDKSNDYDIINAHQTPSEWIRNNNSPVLWYCHSPNREAFDLYQWRMKQRNPLQKTIFWAAIQAFKRFEFQTVPKIEYIFTNSKNSQGRIKKYLKRDAEILYPGVDVERFECKDYGKFFFYPSRITPEKRMELAIEAFRIFSKKNKGWKLIIAGALSNRPEHQKYFTQLKQMAGSGSGVEFRTNVPDSELLGLYARCFAIIYTPLNEDLGLAPLEGFASSKACIAINEGGPRETVLDGIDGFLVSGAEEMAEKMCMLVARPELAEEMGRKGREKVETQFTWKRFLKRFEEKTDDLLQLL